MKKEKAFVLFFLSLLLFSSITTFYLRVIEPVLITFTESNAATLALRTSEDAIRSNLENVTYESIVTEVTNSNGKIVALKTNTNELNKISNNIATSIEENILNLESTYIKIPLGLFFNAGIFGGAGVKVKIKTSPIGDTKIDCISQFDSVGINQTRHRIILRIKTCFVILAPVYVNNQYYEKDVVLAETILSGDIPESYYSLDLNKESDILKLTN